MNHRGGRSGLSGRSGRLIVTVSILVFGVDCVMYSNVIFMEGKDRQCCVVRLVLYCVRVCILIFGVEWVP